MDNFLDKLAERYNAQDMIRANTQAETTQLQSLEEQVEAYEAVLQEMRKLNYKNTELTEKMYALVDESLEKVRHLQIEASEGTASAEAISREMNDAVSRAVSEAMGSMDEGVARTVAASLESALQQPAAELRASTEDVRSSMAAVQSSADTMRSATDEVRTELGQIREGLETIYEDAREGRAIGEELRNAVATLLERSAAPVAVELPERGMPEETSAATEELLRLTQEIEDRAAANSAALEALRGELAAAAGDREAIVNGLAAAAGDRETIVNGLTAAAADREAIVNGLAAAAGDRETIVNGLTAAAADRETIKAELATAAEDRETIKEALAAAISDRERIYEALEAAAENRGALEETLRDTGTDLNDRLFAIQQSNTNMEESLSTFAAAVQSLAENTQGLDPALEERLGQVLGGIEALRQPSQLEDLTQESLSALAQASAQTQDSLTALRASLDGIQASVEQTAGGVGELRAQQQAGAANEELRASLNDLTSSKTEILTQLRNIKSATDEGKTSYKSALDTAVYGLKQDNKELIEFLNRIHTGVQNISNDPERAQREAEAQARAEQDRQALEDRFKLAEDFMHKESVKVYRNVQAVINEKEEKRKEGVENGLQDVEGSVKRVKGIALLSLIVGLINLAVTVLSFFNLL